MTIPEFADLDFFDSTTASNLFEANQPFDWGMLHGLSTEENFEVNDLNILEMNEMEFSPPNFSLPPDLINNVPPLEVPHADEAMDETPAWAPSLSAATDLPSVCLQPPAKASLRMLAPKIPPPYIAASALTTASSSSQNDPNISEGAGEGEVLETATMISMTGEKRRVIDTDDDSHSPRKSAKLSPLQETKVYGVPTGFCFTLGQEQDPEQLNRSLSNQPAEKRAAKSCLRCRQQKLKVREKIQFSVSY